MLRLLLLLRVTRAYCTQNGFLHIASWPAIGPLVFIFIFNRMVYIMCAPECAMLLIHFDCTISRRRKGKNVCSCNKHSINMNKNFRIQVLTAERSYYILIIIIICVLHTIAFIHHSIQLNATRYSNYVFLVEHTECIAKNNNISLNGLIIDASISVDCLPLEHFNKLRDSIVCSVPAMRLPLQHGRQ